MVADVFFEVDTGGLLAVLLVTLMGSVLLSIPALPLLIRVFRFSLLVGLLHPTGNTLSTIVRAAALRWNGRRLTGHAFLTARPTSKFLRGP